VVEHEVAAVRVALPELEGGGHRGGVDGFEEHALAQVGGLLVVDGHLAVGPLDDPGVDDDVGAFDRQITDGLGVADVHLRAQHPRWARPDDAVQRPGGGVVVAARLAGEHDRLVGGAVFHDVGGAGEPVAGHGGQLRDIHQLLSGGEVLIGRVGAHEVDVVAVEGTLAHAQGHEPEGAGPLIAGERESVTSPTMARASSAACAAVVPVPPPPGAATVPPLSSPHAARSAGRPMPATPSAIPRDPAQPRNPRLSIGARAGVLF